MINIVQIGYGYWGSNVARNISLSKKTNLAALVDKDPNRLEAAENTFHDRVELSTDYLPFLNDPEIDAFALAIQTEPSFEIAKQIMQAGKHLFIEKPLTNTVAEAQALLDLLKEKPHLKVQVGHIERFNPAFVSIKHLSLNPLFVECHRLSQFNPRGTDVSVILDLMMEYMVFVEF